DPAEINTLSRDLSMSAQRSVLNLESGHLQRPPDPRRIKVPAPQLLARGVRFRNISARRMLDQPHAEELVRRSAEAGWELRVIRDLPCKMVVIDTSAALL